MSCDSCRSLQPPHRLVRADCTAFWTRSATASGSSCSQKRRTVHPACSRYAVVSLSRSTLRSILSAQYWELVAGWVLPGAVRGEAQSPVVWPLQAVVGLYAVAASTSRWAYLGQSTGRPRGTPHVERCDFASRIELRQLPQVIQGRSREASQGRGRPDGRRRDQGILPNRQRRVHRRPRPVRPRQLLDPTDRSRRSFIPASGEPVETNLFGLHLSIPVDTPTGEGDVHTFAVGGPHCRAGGI